MKINFITLFPEFYEPFRSKSIIEKAVARKLVTINVVDFRTYGIGKHKKVDDTVYGGGTGMLLRVEPIAKALETTAGKRILLSPQGRCFNQQMALELARAPELTFIAGHYEGFDERVRDLIDLELSIGDYVLTGGELPASWIGLSLLGIGRK